MICNYVADNYCMPKNKYTCSAIILVKTQVLFFFRVTIDTNSEKTITNLMVKGACL